jgi:hypothetical protein
MPQRVFVLLAALALPLCGAGDAPIDRATLRGITAVHVVMDPVAPEIVNEGATVDVLRSRLEQLLREAGLQIDPASTEFVALRLMSVRSARGQIITQSRTVAVAASIGLYQPVTLVRDRNMKTATQTWEVETVLMADTKQVYRACMDSVDELAGRFVAAYRSVNPAPEGGRH